jgi:threonyl-tRNA synthetase
LMKIPYMAVVGDQEVANESVALRKRDGTRENDLPAGALVERVVEQIKRRSAEL